MSNHLAFHETNFNVINHKNQKWLTSVEIANALGYKQPDAVTQIFDRNADEFSANMTETLNVRVSGNLVKVVRIFSLRGAHLIAMFSRTKVAKEFRSWVLDLLERELIYPAKEPALEKEAIISKRFSCKTIVTDNETGAISELNITARDIRELVHLFGYNMGFASHAFTLLPRNQLKQIN